MNELSEKDKHSRKKREKNLRKKVRLFIFQTVLVICLLGLVGWKNDPAIRQFMAQNIPGLSFLTSGQEQIGQTEEELAAETTEEALVTVPVTPTETPIITPEEVVPAEVAPTDTPAPTEEVTVDPRADGIQVGISWCDEIADDGTMTETQQNFYNAIVAAGGQPVFLPLVTDLDSALAVLNTVDCLVLTGGKDINPAMYGQEAELTYQHDFSDERDTSDYWMIVAAMQKNMPTLGVCRGLQMINVVMGGTLIQDIPNDLGTDVLHQDPTLQGAVYHSITVEPETSLYAITGADQLWVNSYHHQCIGILADGLRVSARADDGVVEAAEAENYKFIIGIQFHPEILYSLQDTSALIYFTALMAAV